MLTKRRQSGIDIAISGFNAMRYGLFEPWYLRFNRSRFENQYTNRSQQPLVTIGIATYNRSQILIERTLPSLLAQTYSNIEILIIGDRCIDDTPERMKTIKDSRVRFYDLPKRGTYPSSPAERWFVQGSVPRNKALELARGQWINWISDDDLLLPDAIASLVQFAQSGDYEFVSACYTQESQNGNKLIDVKDTHPRIGGMQTWLYRSYLRFFRWNIQSWRKSWNRPCDYDLQVRMTNAGVRMGFLEKVVAHVPYTPGTSEVGIKAQLDLAQKGMMP